MRDSILLRSGRTYGFAGALCALFALVPFQAQAYIDPGTSAMLVQLVLGGVAGLMVVGKLYWQRIKALFGFGAAELEVANDGIADADESPTKGRDGE